MFLVVERRKEVSERKKEREEERKRVKKEKGKKKKGGRERERERERDRGNNPPHGVTYIVGFDSLEGHTGGGTDKPQVAATAECGWNWR